MSSSRTPFYYAPLSPNLEAPTRRADIVIYGGTSGGVIAAVAAAQKGKKAILLVFNDKIGGMTAGGLGRTDIGNQDAFGGLSRSFYERVGVHYGEEMGWNFEPHVAAKVLQQMLDDSGAEVVHFQRLQSVAKDGEKIRAITMETGEVYEAAAFIDASYEGDLLAAAGVSFAVGRESQDDFGEIFAGKQFVHPAHNYTSWVDPWKEKGNPASGLCWGLLDEAPGLAGSGDKAIQAYNFRMCLTQAEDRIPFPRPLDYDPARYELLLRFIESGTHNALDLTAWMPNGKTDTNNHGAFSSDMIGANWEWPEASYARREEIFQAHVSYQQGLYYFLANDPRVPEFIRRETAEFGLPADEFVASGGWPHELYVREARRMQSDYVMTEKNCIGGEEPDDPIALAAYQIDSHNCRRLVVHGRAYNEGNVEIRVPRPFPISYRSLVPKRGEVENLLVPWALSSTHIAFGSIRMEPVFMVLGQVCAIAAAQAIDGGSRVQDVDYATLRSALLDAGIRLAWPVEGATPMKGNVGPAWRSAYRPW